MILIIAGIIIVLVIIMILIININKQKFLDLNIKLNEAENNMDIILEKKIELFDRLINHMKKKKIEASYPEIVELKALKSDHLGLHNALFDAYTKIIHIVDDNEEKLLDEKSISLLDQISDNEDDLTATVKYYNDNATDFNFLVSHFPSSIAAFLSHFKTLQLFRNEKRERFEILKEK